jgi:hypothetical protein
VNGRPRLDRRRTDEAVDPAERALDLAKNRKHLGAVGNIEAQCGDAGHIRQRGQRRRVDVADYDAGAGLRGGTGQSAADAIGAAGHHDHVSLGLEARAHLKPLLPRAAQTRNRRCRRAQRSR